MESVKELIDQLNITDECTTIEAKRGTAIDKSIMETVCAFANEPGLGGGYILLGVEKDMTMLFPFYTTTGVSQPDKLQLDISSNCGSMFNITLRPQIEIEIINGKPVVKVFIPELADGQKLLYFKNQGMPGGVFRRIGSSDQKCTDEDMAVFFSHSESYDSLPIKDTDMNDVDEVAVDLYRDLRQSVSIYAEEFNYPDREMLRALGAAKMNVQNIELTYCGLLVFGKRISLRRVLPMVRVDYIRVPGNEWVENPDQRFRTIDMRGSLLELVQRTFTAIADDLPKGFLLYEGELQAESIGLPSKVLREAIVNAFMHRTYRVDQPTQIIRYSNRIEIKNPGFSLKPEDQLGEPGSRNRNPFIAAIFHDTNLAETKGSGIKTMRTLMERANMAPPTFESDHASNQFTTRLLLHHFLNESDIAWLRKFHNYDLSDSQKRGLIFIREAGAIDNSAYRQLNGCDIMKSSVELRGMRDSNLLTQKGKGRYTYYIPGAVFLATLDSLITTGVEVRSQNTEVKSQNTEVKSQNTEVKSQNTGAFVKSEEPPTELVTKIENLGKKADSQEIEDVIYRLCKWRPLTVSQIAKILNRNGDHLLRKFIAPMREHGKLEYLYPDLPNHPNQAYKASELL